MSWEQNNRCLVIAHRGDTKKGIENTLTAIESALALGVDGIEVDLQLTRDGKVVLFHDDSLKRLAKRPGSIQDLTLQQCRSLKLIQNASIPTLEELLDLVKDRCLLNLEIKVSRSGYRFGNGELETEIVKTLGLFSLNENIVISSFHPISLWRVRQLLPELKRGMLFHKYYPLHRLLTPFTKPFSIHAPLSHITLKCIKKIKQSRRRCLVWTVNRENDMKWCLRAGVHGIITDEPGKLLQLIKGKNQ